jgi:Sulfotransferase domain
MHTFFIGAPKCATTSLWNMFKYRDDIYVPEYKDTMFFIRDYWQNNYFNPGRDIYDFQPNHCLFPYVPQRIEDTIGEFRVVLVIRDPIERAYSEMCHFKKMRPGRLEGNFNDIIRHNLDIYNPNLFENEGEYMMQMDPRGGCYRHVFIENSVYKNHMHRFRNQEKYIMMYEELARDPIYSIGALCEWLKIDSWFPNDFSESNSMSDGGSFDDETTNLLQKFFTETIYD